MATPSAKPGATPTHFNSSPHPSSAPLSRSFAHRSPLTRTPSASGPGHGPQFSSSHQYPTPLAVTSGVDDPVNFSSPSALLALGGYTGISPSPAVHDGLVGASMNENDIQNLGMQSFKLGVSRDSDVEQRHRIQEVVQCLRARVAGRGVSREGVERLSRLEGFESIWQENNINIAGNFVDLEIEFHAGHDVVKDVSLKYATPEYTEGERREEATAVLKRNLAQSPHDGESGNWRSLQGFYENLQWLAKLDKLSQEVNCFEALEGLEENFKRIWKAEEMNGKHGGVYEHLCTGVIGRPSMHKGARVGLSLEYWVEQAKLLDAKQPAPFSDAMAIDGPSDQDADGEVDGQRRTWGVMVECEEGYPSLRISKEWVGTDVFPAGASNEPPPENGSAGAVNWLDPSPTMRLSHGSHPDPMALDSSMLDTSAPNRRFVARLEPALDVPILAASEIYRQLGMQLPQEFRMVTYDGLLVSEGSPLTSAEPSAQRGRRKCKISVPAYDLKGKKYTNQHRYTFQAFEAVAGRTIRDLPFSHPRQLADILPVLRQYALLASLVRRTFQSPAKDREEKLGSSNVAAASTLAPPDQNSGFFSSQSGLVILSNDNPHEEKLDLLLGGNSADDSLSDSANPTSLPGDHSGKDLMSGNEVQVDVTLRTQLGQAPALMLLLTVPDQNTQDVGPVPSSTDPKQIFICVEIGVNGRISTVGSAGLLNTESSGISGDADMQRTEDSTPGMLELHKKIARVLEVSQDLGTLIEWVLRRLRQRAGSG